MFSNVSLIFWHIFIALSTLVIVISLAIFLWSITPSLQRTVEKQKYPEKKQYPAPVKVAFNELKLEEAKKIEAPLVAPEPIQTKPRVTKLQPVEDTKGKAEYEASLNLFKTLIPTNQWNGKGRWIYPWGERYWSL